MKTRSRRTLALGRGKALNARRFQEADRLRYPLERMRGGREFLATLRGLRGLDVTKAGRPRRPRNPLRLLRVPPA